MPAEFVPDRIHIRNVLLFLFLSSAKKPDAERQLSNVYPGHAPHRNTISHWYSRFEEGDYSLKDEERSGRPSEVDLDKLKDLLKEDPFQSSREMATTLGVSHRTVLNDLEKLGKVKKLAVLSPTNCLISTLTVVLMPVLLFSLSTKEHVG